MKQKIVCLKCLGWVLLVLLNLVILSPKLGVSCQQSTY